MELVFATNNKHKLEEISHILDEHYKIVSLKEIGCNEDIAETAETLEGNALLKARYIHSRYGRDCFADDTGLEIDALEGKPGVFSARYAGPGHDHQKNMDKVLFEMAGQANRKAQFRTVIALILEGQEYLFEGIVKGEILTERHGDKGFGYDPIFKPDGFDLSFAEMDLDDKNEISHRGRATRKLVEFLNQL
ncbi:MAG TPA: non-canonical purine NTP diphosphatase [Bacteroidales bacterium]|nr:non-canonical purine NTP diphosphatase [Bacteroidales bacterium]HRX98054.1 non-canonical purine NTP diphosphatase [Bacteroidales bacterium]